MLPAWIEDIGEHLPLSVRRMKPLQMINESGLLLLARELQNCPPVLESHGMISFCHLNGVHQGAAYLLSVFCKKGVNALVCGPSGSGKTAMVHAVTASMPENYAITCLHDPQNSHKLGGVIRDTFSVVKRQKKNVFSGIAGKSWVTIILDDVALEQGSTNNSDKILLPGPISVADSLQSLVCENGFHDMTTLMWRCVEKFNIILTSRSSSEITRPFGDLKKLPIGPIVK